MRRLVLSIIVLTAAIALLGTEPVQSRTTTKAWGVSTIKPLTMEQMDIRFIDRVYIVDRAFEDAFGTPTVLMTSSSLNPPPARKRGMTVREHHSNTKNRHRVLAT